MERKRIIISTVVVFLLIPTVSWSRTYEWTVYNTSNSELPHNDLPVLTIDTQRNFWIGTDGGRLNESVKGPLVVKQNQDSICLALKGRKEGIQ